MATIWNSQTICQILQRTFHDVQWACGYPINRDAVRVVGRTGDRWASYEIPGIALDGGESVIVGMIETAAKSIYIELGMEPPNSLTSTKATQPPLPARCGGTCEDRNNPEHLKKTMTPHARVYLCPCGQAWEKTHGAPAKAISQVKYRSYEIAPEPAEPTPKPNMDTINKVMAHHYKPIEYIKGPSPLTKYISDKPPDPEGGLEYLYNKAVRGEIPIENFSKP